MQYKSKHIRYEDKNTFKGRTCHDVRSKPQRTRSCQSPHGMASQRRHHHAATPSGWLHQDAEGLQLSTGTNHRGFSWRTVRSPLRGGTKHFVTKRLRLRNTPLRNADATMGCTEYLTSIRSACPTSYSPPFYGLSSQTLPSPLRKSGRVWV